MQKVYISNKRCVLLILIDKSDEQFIFRFEPQHTAYDERTRGFGVSDKYCSLTLYKPDIKRHSDEILEKCRDTSLATIGVSGRMWWTRPRNSRYYSISATSVYGCVEYSRSCYKAMYE